MASKSRMRTSFAALSLAGLSAAAPFPPPAHAQSPAAWPSQVHAVYRIEFNGFDVGTFEFNSAVSGQSYTLTGDARLSALLGAFTWKGATRSSGAVTGDVPAPAGYTFDFSGTSKSGSVKMGFQGNSVTNVAVLPAQDPVPSTVPVKDIHLKSVLDPLSAVMALARGTSENPCGRKLSIFDGKQRFDLLLSYKRQERVADPRPTGQPGIAFVCQVRYVPIAGHKASEETRAMAASQGIEVSLRPVPSANLFIPHQISVPTGAGTATLTAARINIVTKNEEIALGH